MKSASTIYSVWGVFENLLSKLNKDLIKELDDAVKSDNLLSHSIGNAENEFCTKTRFLYELYSGEPELMSTAGLLRKPPGLAKAFMLAYHCGFGKESIDEHVGKEIVKAHVRNMDFLVLNYLPTSQHSNKFVLSNTKERDQLLSIIETVQCTGGLVRYSDGHHAPVADKGWTDLGFEVMKAVTLLKTDGVDVDVDIDILDYTTKQQGIHG